MSDLLFFNIFVFHSESNPLITRSLNFTNLPPSIGRHFLGHRSYFVLKRCQTLRFSFRSCLKLFILVSFTFYILSFIKNCSNSGERYNCEYFARVGISGHEPILRQKNTTSWNSSISTTTKSFSGIGGTSCYTTLKSINQWCTNEFCTI